MAEKLTVHCIVDGQDYHVDEGLYLATYPRLFDSGQTRLS